VVDPLAAIIAPFTHRRSIVVLHGADGTLSVQDILQMLLAGSASTVSHMFSFNFVERHCAGDSRTSLSPLIIVYRSLEMLQGNVLDNEDTFFPTRSLRFR
jgi:hypothetical protein